MLLERWYLNQVMEDPNTAHFVCFPSLAHNVSIGSNLFMVNYCSVEYASCHFHFQKPE